MFKTKHPIKVTFTKENTLYKINLQDKIPEGEYLFYSENGDKNFYDFYNDIYEIKSVNSIKGSKYEIKRKQIIGKNEFINVTQLNEIKENRVYYLYELKQEENEYLTDLVEFRNIYNNVSDINCNIINEFLNQLKEKLNDRIDDIGSFEYILTLFYLKENCNKIIKLITKFFNTFPDSIYTEKINVLKYILTKNKNATSNSIKFLYSNEVILSTTLICLKDNNFFDNLVDTINDKNLKSLAILGHGSKSSTKIKIKETKCDREPLDKPIAEILGNINLKINDLILIACNSDDIHINSLKNVSSLIKCDGGLGSRAIFNITFAIKFTKAYGLKGHYLFFVIKEFVYLYHRCYLNLSYEEK